MPKKRTQISIVRFLPILLSLLVIVGIVLLVNSVDQEEMAGTVGQAGLPRSQITSMRNPTIALEIGVAKNFMDFDRHELQAKAGEWVSLTLRNQSDPTLDYNYNWVLVTPGKEGVVGVSSLRAGPERDYVPDSPYVLARTRILEPGESQTITFRAPEQPGEYPFLSTFPGHAKKVRGVLRVE